MDEKQLTAITEHAVVTLAQHITRAGGEERWTIDPKGALRLEAAILQHINDPLLPGVLRALFGMVGTLFEHEASPGAARALVAVLARVEPHIRRALASRTERVHAPAPAEEAQRRSRNLLGGRSEARASSICEQPPPGAIAVRSLGIQDPARSLTRTGPAGVRATAAGPAPMHWSDVSPSSPKAPEVATSSASPSSAKGVERPVHPAQRAPYRRRSQPRYRLMDDPPPTGLPGR